MGNTLPFAGSTAAQALSVYNVADGRVVAHLAFDTLHGNLTGACLSADGSTIYYGVDSGKVYSYVISSEVQTVLNFTAPINDGPSLFCASHDGKTLGFIITDLTNNASRICLYNLATKQLIKEFDYLPNGSPGQTTSLNFVNGDLNVVADGPVIYDFDGSVVAAAPSGFYFGGHLVVSPDETRIFSSPPTEYPTQDYVLAYTASPLNLMWQELPGESTTYQWGEGSFGVSSDGSVLLMGTEAGYLIMLSTADGSLLGNPFLEKPFSWDLATAPNVNQVLIGPGSLGAGGIPSTPTGEMLSFDSFSGAGQFLGTFMGGLSALQNSRFTTDFVTTFTVNSRPVVSIDELYVPPPNINYVGYQTIRNAETGSILSTLPEGAVVSPDGSDYVLPNGSDVNVYDTASGDLLASFAEPGELNTNGIYWAGASEIAVSQNSGSPSTTAYVLSFANQTLTNLDSFAVAGRYALSSDGTRFAAIQKGGSVGVFSVATGALLGTISTDIGSAIDDLSLSNTNRIGVHETATVTGDAPFETEFRVFDISSSTFKLLNKFEFSGSNANNEDAADGTLSPDGQTVVMGAFWGSSATDPRSAGTVRLYSVTSGLQYRQWDNQFVPDFRATDTFAFSGDDSVVYWTTTGAIVAAPTAADLNSLSIALSPSSVVGGATSTATVSISPAQKTATVVNLSSPSTLLTIPSSVTIPAGKTSVAFTVQTTAVDETTGAAIEAAVGGVSTSATLKVTPATALTLTLSPPSLVGGASAVGTVLLNGPAGPSGLTIAVSSSNAAVVTVSPTVMITAGQKSATFVATTVAVASVKSVVLTAKLGTASATSTLTVNAPTVSGLSLSPSSVVGGATSTGTVKISSAAPSTGLVITLSSNSNSATLPATATVSAGATSATFTVQTSAVQSNVTASITAKNGTVSKSANLAIAAPTLSAIGFNPSSVFGGASSTGTIVISSPAPSAGFVVTLSSNSPDATVPTTITVPGGKTSVTFPVATIPVASTTIATITAKHGTISKTASLTIKPPTLASISLNPSTVKGGASSIATVTLGSAAPSGGLAVTLSSSSPAAKIPGTVTIPVGKASATVTVTTVKVTAQVTATIKATLGSTSKTATLTVTP